MPALSFEITSASAVEFAAAPTLAFGVTATNTPADERLDAILLRVQLRLEPSARSYSDAEAEGLYELFGERARWGDTMRPMLWTHAQAVVPPFAGAVTFELPVPCTYDFNVAVTRWFHAVGTGSVPVNFLYSGTVYFTGPSGTMQVAQVPWSCESHWAMPVQTWKTMMAHYYPDTVSLAVRRDVFDRLDRFRRSEKLVSFDQAVDRLLVNR